jgi:hypothetical protein
MLWQDAAWVLVDMGGFAIILRDLRPRAWSRTDSYWLLVGAPASAILSATLHLWLCAALWTAYTILRAIQRANLRLGGGL